MAERAVLMTVLSFLLMLSSCSALRVLMLSMQISGHFSEFGGIAKHLIAKGHEVYAVTDDNNKHPNLLKSVTGLKYLHYKSPNKDLVASKVDDEISALMFTGKPDAEQALARKKVSYDCWQAMDDDDLFKKMQDLKFDFALVDGLFFCFQPIPYRLGIPYAALTPMVLPLLVKTNPLLSLQPCTSLKTSNTIFDRIKQLFIAFMVNSVPDFFYDDKKFVAHLNARTDKPVRSLTDLAEKTSFWISNQNPVLDCPVPSNPNLVYAGGVGASPPKQLPADFATFLKQSREGVIVVSFGSMTKKLPLDIAKRFMKAFALIKQGVIMRYTKQPGQDIDIPSNVMISGWLPQNDLLGQPEVKLFLTHGGNNGQAESLYHAVPSIGFPLHGDQIYNADRFVKKGFGLLMDMFTFTPEELAQNIKEVIENPSYAKNIKKTSVLFKELSDPRAAVVDMIEHVVKHGDGQLRTAANEMDFFQIYMWDICALVTVTLTILLHVIAYIIYVVCKKCFGQKKVKQN